MSSSFKEQYDQRKEMVLNLLDITRGHYEKFKNEEKIEIFNELYQNVEKGNFSIVVVGEFSAGKSTFLNTLMGDKYLPSFSTETTATVNFLKNKELSPNGSEVIIKYKNNEDKSIEKADIEELKKYVSTKSEIDVANEIEHVNLYIDSKFLKEGVTLVDSPGLNGIAEGHREITEKQIEKSHACIFIFDSNQPGRKSEFEFLAKLKEKVNTIIFVLNKIDEIKLSEQSVEDIENNLKKNYKKHFQDDAISEIWPVAAYPALIARGTGSFDYRRKMEHTDEEKKMYLKTSKMEEFEDRLWKFLTQGEKAKQELLAPVERVMNILSHRKKHLENEIYELQNVNDVDDIMLEINGLEKEIENLEESLGEKYNEIDDQLKTIIRELKENLKSETLRLRDRYLLKINDWTDLDEVNGDVDRFNKKIQQDFMTVVKRVYDDFIEQFEQIVSAKYREYSSEIQKSIDSFNENDKTVDIEVACTISDEDLNVSFGLEEYESTINEYEKKLEEIEKEIDHVSDKLIQAEILENKKEDIENQIKSIKDRQQSFEAILGPRPSAAKTTRMDYENRSRGGLVGIIVDGLFGKKHYQVERVEVDDTDSKYYDEQKKRLEDRYENEEHELRRKIKELGKLDKNSKQYELAENKLQRSRIKKEQELEAYRAEYRDKFQKKYRKALNNIKDGLSDYIDELEKEVEKELYKKVRGQKTQLTNIVIDIINKNIRESINKKKEERDIRRRQLESSVEEKEKLIEVSGKEIQDIDNILEKSVEVYSELSMVEVDEIEKIEI